METNQEFTFKTNSKQEFMEAISGPQITRALEEFGDYLRKGIKNQLEFNTGQEERVLEKITECFFNVLAQNGIMIADE